MTLTGFSPDPGAFVQKSGITFRSGLNDSLAALDRLVVGVELSDPNLSGRTEHLAVDVGNNHTFRVIDDGDRLRSDNQAARARSPASWSGHTRNWDAVRFVWLNPERPKDEWQGRGDADALPHETGGGDPMAGRERDAA